VKADDHRLIERPRLGDLVISRPGHWHVPRLVVEVHTTAKALYGVLSDGEIKYIHYKHLEVISESL
jgi:hypothetical protein